MGEDAQLKAEQDESVDQEALDDVSLEAMRDADAQDLPDGSIPLDD